MNAFRFVVFGIVGAFVGSVLRYEGTLLFGLAIGLLFAAVLWLSGRVAELERKLARAARPAPAVAAEPPPTARPAVPASRPADAEAELFKLELPFPAERTPAAPPRSPAPRSPAPRPPAPRAEPAAGSADELVARLRGLIFGGNPVVRVGLIVLFFGVAFLFKFAAERQLVPVEVRYLGVVAVAIALLVVGWRQRQKRAGFALLAQGGAVGMLYITVFAAMRLHGLIPAPLAFGLLVALVLLSGMLAVLQDARGLAVAGAAGGFLAPVLVSTGSGNHVALFSYYTLLNAGVLGVAWYRSWRVLNLVGFVFTFAIGGAWGFFKYRPEHLWTTEPFLILFFLMFVALSVLHATRQPPQLKGYVDGTLVFGLPVIAFGLQAGMVREIEFGMAWSALGMALLYLGLAVALWRRAGEGLRLLVEAFLALGVVFGSLAIPLALEGHWTTAAWALEGAALVWIGVRQGRLASRLFGLLLQLGAGLFFFAGLDYQPYEETAVFHVRFLGGLCLALAGLSSAYQFRQRERLREWEAPLEFLLLGWGIVWWFGTAFHEVDEQMARADVVHGLAATTAVTALVMSEASHRLAWRALALPLAAAGWLLLFFAFGDLFNDHPFDRFGFLVWGGAMAALYGVLRRQEKVLPPLALGLQHQTGLWLAALLLSAELSWGLAQLAEGGAVWHLVAWGIVPLALALLVIRVGPRVPWPLAAWRREYASAGPMPMVALVAFGCAVSALVVEGDPSPLAYMPLLNPLELAQLFVLLGLVRWRLLAVAPAAVPAAVLDGAIGVTAFAVLNGMLARAVHFYRDVPFDWDYLLATTELQTAFAVAWTLIALALTVTAARLGRRQLWLLGAALLGVVVGKLFLVDLASSNTIARIVSFLGVGALMMAIGFFAPLPPAQRKEA